MFTNFFATLNHGGRKLNQTTSMIKRS